MKKLGLLLSVLMLVSCAPQPAHEVVEVTVLVTQPPLPTHTPYPTYTPLPPLPTYTSYPTYTPLSPLPTNTPTLSPTGLSRLNPIPMGESVVADNDIELTVLGLERDAWPTIYEANMFNPTPDEGMEYVIVTIQVRNLGDPAKTAKVGGLDFRLVGERGTIYDRRMVMLDRQLDIELFGGGVAEGRIAFQVVQGEKDLVLIYDSGLDTKARYLYAISETHGAEPTATVAPTPTPGAWYEIARWTGTSDKNTETFHIPSHEWRISWEVGEGDFGTNFQILVYDTAGNLVDEGGLITEPSQDSTIMRGAGDYYLSITAMQPYTVVVEAR